MKYKILPSLALCTCGIISPYSIFAACTIETSAPKSVTEYVQNVQKEVQEIKSSLESAGKCGGNYNSMTITDYVRNQQELQEKTSLDAEFRIEPEKNGTAKHAVIRDYEYMESSEKALRKSIQEISKSCNTEGENGVRLIVILREFGEMKTQMLRTTLGKQKATVHKDIREENTAVFEEISTAYNPANTLECESSAEYEEKTKNSLKNIFLTGWGLEDALASWSKAISLFRGGEGMSSSEYISIQRKALMGELSKQGVSSSTRQTILNNFDCFKAKTADGTQLEEMANARMACLSNPIQGLDKNFFEWRNYIGASKDLTELTERAQTYTQRYARTVDITKVYGNLKSMTSQQDDIDKESLESLVNLHMSIMLTNEHLEKRIPKIQKNCMKGQPDVKGGCAD